MMSLEYECIFTSDLKMSTRVQANDGREEKEELVRRVGGRGRSLVQADLRVRRERAGRTPPNWLGTPNAQGQGQEVGPRGLEERRLGEFWTRNVGNRTMVNGPGTADMGTNRQRRVRERPSTPSYIQATL